MFWALYIEGSTFPISASYKTKTCTIEEYIFNMLMELISQRFHVIFIGILTSSDDQFQIK